MLHYHGTSVPGSMRAEQVKNLLTEKNQSALNLSESLNHRAFDYKDNMTFDSNGILRI